ncbi:RsmD family RNA methyltransferase [Candidatus Parcubacteria bacterium]|nr:RsmD family RNA methyltransferase [Candidatus Parcubacteria bacterium]
MQYFFILGTNPTLSIAELSAVFNLRNVTKDTKCPSLLRRSGYEGRVGHLVSNNVFLLETDKNINAQQLIKKIGGVIKIGKIAAKADAQNKEKILEEIKKLLKPKNGKFKFGISCYNGKKINIKPLAMEIKKYLSEKGFSSRWVTSKEPTLSSVVIGQNKLTSKGAEIVLIKDNNKIFISQTLAVQPFKELSFRDYGRPARDDRSGMLPPKLAQIMINLALPPSPYQGEVRGEVILDPFCGSGTILTEAMLMGFKNLIGADISKKAISNTNENINWIKKHYDLTPNTYNLYNKSATELSKFIKPKFIDAIITEPYLGPPRGKFDIKKTVHELKQLYTKSLTEFKKVLKHNGRVVMIWPIFRVTHKVERITPNLGGFKIINPIPKNLQSNKAIQLTDRNTIVYGRPGQKVWREIVILRQ